MLIDVFEGELSPEDWEHALGGIHALAYDGDEVVGHASVVMRRLLHRDLSLRTGYVEAVGVREDHRGSGVGRELMDAVERVIAGGYEIGALGIAEEAIGFYEKRGWLRWAGTTGVLTPGGIEATPHEDGFIFVLPLLTRLDLEGELTCDWRMGDVW